MGIALHSEDMCGYRRSSPRLQAVSAAKIVAAAPRKDREARSESPALAFHRPAVVVTKAAKVGSLVGLDDHEASAWLNVYYQPNCRYRNHVGLPKRNHGSIWVFTVGSLL
jgi:hypothetical protein